MSELLVNTIKGLYCEIGDFYIDPSQPVGKSIITHGHSDHARASASLSICHHNTVNILKHRLGDEGNYCGLEYQESILINGVKVSLHPAGHILGSAQVRLEFRGEIWVVTGDYKLASDPTCTEYEFVKCHHLITESTFGLPIFKWQENSVLFSEINQWWLGNQQAKKPSLLGAYSLGKAQRIMASIDSSIGPIYLHGAVANLMPCYKLAGIKLPEFKTVDLRNKTQDFYNALIIAPPSALDTPWSSRFVNHSKSFASGWMCIRGNRRRRNLSHGFAISDHADWPGLLTAIKNSEAEEVIVTHGYAEEMSRYLNENNIAAKPLRRVIS